MLPRAAILILALTCSAAAQSSPGDRADVTRFADEFFAREMDARHVPGAVITVVKDGRVVLSKGYGLARVEPKLAADPERTLWRAASVAKIFTATAAMQQVERGKIHLHEDLNRYVRDFNVPGGFGRPITLADLLTQSAGFDERSNGLAAPSREERQSLGEYLARNMPARSFTPGEAISYSHYGSALAGYMVQTASATPFAAYMDDNIFVPLGMLHSSFDLPAQWEKDLAVGYSWRNGRYEPLAFDYDNAVPASGLVTTANDMARFLIAQLAHGRYGNARILSDESSAAMQARQFSGDPRVGGYCWGYYERFLNGERLIGHSGDWNGFGSMMFLLPERNLGIFVAYNNFSLGAMADRRQPPLNEALLAAFMDRYFPHRPIAPRAMPVSGNATKVAGAYRSYRYARNTFEKLATVGSTLNVVASPDGSITVNYPYGREPDRWVEIAPLVFQRDNGSQFLAFKPHGNRYDAWLTWGSPQTFMKVAWWDRPRTHLLVLGACMLIFFISFVAWGAGWLIRAVYRLPGSLGVPRTVALSACAASMVFFFAFGTAVAELWPQMVYGVPLLVKALLLLPMAAAALTLVVAVMTVRMWAHGESRLFGRVWMTVVTLALALFLVDLNYWNLLGFRY